MKILSLYKFSFISASLLLAACLILASSCKEPPVKYQLPVSDCQKDVQSPCEFEEIRNFDRVPEKIKSQARAALLKFMDSVELDRQIEFIKFKFYEDCPELELHGQRYIPYKMHFVRHFDTPVITSLCLNLSFNIEQEYLGCWGLGNINHDPRYKNYLSKATLDSILQVHNYLDYTGVQSSYNGSRHELRFYKKEKLKDGYRRHKSSATVNLHTGEFNSKEEWNEATAININLLPKYGTAEKTPAQLEEHRQFIDSMLQDGQTPRAASAKLIEKATKFLNDRKPKKAMPLFNQAYLLDSTNANVYWGFGMLSYKDLDQDAKSWFDIGLALDSANVNLIRAYGRYEWNRFAFYDEKRSDPDFRNMMGIDSTWYAEKADQKFDLAEGYFLKALALAPDHLKTMSNLADLYLDKVECENAKAYYEKSKILRDNCSEQCFERQLARKCGSI